MKANSYPDDASLINGSTRQGIEIIARSWPTWLGMAGILVVIVMMLSQTGRAIQSGAATSGRLEDQNALQQGLRIAFLFISSGTLLQSEFRRDPTWRRAVGVAKLLLVIGVAGEVLRATTMMERLSGIGDSIEPRLFRLGAMATFAVPMLVLLAACEESRKTEGQACRQVSSRIGSLLVRWEPVFFAVGASTLPSILLAGAMVNRELIWLSPIGADSTVAACIAASIRAQARHDRLAFNGWLLVSLSMCIGLLMGGYAFGGPLPTPSMIGAYDSLPRILLRDAHVVLMSIGIIAIALASTRTAREKLP